MMNAINGKNGRFMTLWKVLMALLINTFQDVGSVCEPLKIKTTSWMFWNQSPDLNPTEDQWQDFTKKTLFSPDPHAA